MMHERLFATVGNGGVQMLQTLDGPIPETKPHEKARLHNPMPWILKALPYNEPPDLDKYGLPRSMRIGGLMYCGWYGMKVEETENVIELNITPEDIEELIKVHQLMYGSSGSAIVSEVALGYSATARTHFDNAVWFFATSTFYSLPHVAGGVKIQFQKGNDEIHDPATPKGS